MNEARAARVKVRIDVCSTTANSCCCHIPTRLLFVTIVSRSLSRRRRNTFSPNGPVIKPLLILLSSSCRRRCRRRCRVRTRTSFAPGYFANPSPLRSQKSRLSSALSSQYSVGTLQAVRASLRSAEQGTCTEYPSILLANDLQFVVIVSATTLSYCVMSCRVAN